MLRDRRSSQNFIRVIKSRRMGWAKYAARMGERRDAYGFKVWKPERRRKPRRSEVCVWENNIKIDSQEVE
jgi:hypothetical protein